MNKRSKLIAVAATAAIALGTLAGCSGDQGGGGDGNVTLTWWHNGTGEPLLSLWQSVADDFHKAHPNVTVKVEAYQNEELQRTLIPNALRAGSGVDLFQQWGAGELAAQVNAGYVMDISDQVKDEVASIGGTVAPWQFEGKTYGLPFQFGIEGFWYNKDSSAKPESLHRRRRSTSCTPTSAC